MMNLPQQIVIEEQGPRDGLQSEKKQVPTEKKLQLIHDAVAFGAKRVQVTSFVHPKWVPQIVSNMVSKNGFPHGFHWIPFDYPGEPLF